MRAVESYQYGSMGMRVIGSLVVLGVVAASCSSDATKKHAPPVSSNAAGEGGDTSEGGTSAGGSGTAASAADGGVAGESAALGGGEAGVGEGGIANEGGAPAGGASSGGDGGGIATAMTDGYLSGTRLKAALQVAGAARRFVSWHDSMLGFDCSFRVDSAGVQRCMPGNTVGYAGFADTDCRQPIVVYDAAETPSAYFADPGYEFTCGIGPRFLSVGALSSATEIHSKDDAGNCGPAYDIAAGQIAHQLGAVVPDSTFVGVSGVETEARDARLAASVRIASDGSREVTAFYDLSRKTECNPLEVRSAAWSCVPDARAYIEYFFADAACTVPAAFHPGYAQQVCGFTPDIVQNTSPNFTSTYFEVGAKLDAAVHNDNGAACPVYNAPASLFASFYSVGAPVQTSAFAPFSLTIEGTGRMRVQVLRNPEGGAMAYEQFYDSTLAGPCYARTAADLQQRCLPATAFTNNLFSDNECKQAIFATAAGTPLPADLVYVGSLQTNGGEAIFKVGQKTATPVHTYELNGLECVEGGLSPAQDYYATSIVPPSDLPAVTIQVE
ncbi:MAG: hypothetical protein ABJB12_19490 [Pseudomonadota bacterium]